MTHFITWWVHASFSQVAFVMLAAALLIGVLGILIGKCCAINEPPKPREYPTVDYSAARARQIEWLGPRYLLHTPVNRKVRT